MESGTTRDGTPKRWFSLLRRDFARYYTRERSDSLLKKVRVFLDAPGLHATITYRYGSWVARTIRLKIIRYPLLLVHWILQKLCMICWGIFIHEGARIGPGLYIGHFGGIVVGPIQMGRDCTINQQVSIGVRGDGGRGMPSFGDRVWIGTGSLVYGDVTIGDGVMIAPHTVVSRSLPSRVLVSGNPLRVLAKDYENAPAIYGTPYTTEDGVLVSRPMSDLDEPQ